MIELPEALEVEHYIASWPDLSRLDAEAAAQHYRRYGRVEGRRANQLVSRQDFVNLVPTHVPALEIGPFYSPALAGPHVSYFDVISQNELRRRAAELGADATRTPRIDYVSPTGDLAVVNRAFVSVLSSHCIEHQPDLIYHLQQVSRVLVSGGRYFLLIPDKRYCFDYFIDESSVAEVVSAHQQRRSTHPLRSVIEHRAMTTHNDVARHWAGDHGSIPDDHETRILKAMDEYRDAAGDYIDVHGWYFTPDNVSEIFNTLLRLKLIDLQIERCYPTRLQTNEFWMVLRKTR